MRDHRSHLKCFPMVIHMCNDGPMGMDVKLFALASTITDKIPTLNLTLRKFLPTMPRM